VSNPIAGMRLTLAERFDSNESNASTSIDADWHNSRLPTLKIVRSR
jgi:hypothetical protein